METLRELITTGVLGPWLAALLAHATLAVLASVLLEVWTRGREGEKGDRPASTKRPEGGFAGTGLVPSFANDVRRVFIRPLGQTALLSSSLAIPVLALVSWQETLFGEGLLVRACGRRGTAMRREEADQHLRHDLSYARLQAVDLEPKSGKELG